jgi:hypothetical protein
MSQDASSRRFTQLHNFPFCIDESTVPPRDSRRNSGARRGRRRRRSVNRSREEHSGRGSHRSRRRRRSGRWRPSPAEPPLVGGQELPHLSPQDKGRNCVPKGKLLLIVVCCLLVCLVFRKASLIMSGLPSRPLASCVSQNKREREQNASKIWGLGVFLGATLSQSITMKYITS